MLSANHKSAELDKAGHRETSATRGGPVSELDMGRATEPMVEAPVEHGRRQCRSGRRGREAGGALEGLGDSQAGVAFLRRQWTTAPAVVVDPNPHGVKSVPKAGERTETKPKNRSTASPSLKVMIEATDDRDGMGRSPRSSPRTGKPSTWRRGTVDTASKQEVDTCPAR